ncbi:MAG: HPF/RaiA family ribosome-associated protein [Bdellovibrio sp.]|nr:HPF/RaiA family ribosome-associated protein [Bdellovibrio sp.]
MFPIEISYRDFESSKALQDKIYQEAAKLGRYFEQIMFCRVVVSAPHRHHHQGKVYHVNILINIPGLDEIVVTNEPETNKGHEDAFVAIRDAFRSMEQELSHRFKKMSDRRREGNRSRQLHGIVEKLFPGEDYGFAKGEDGIDYYFHKNSVLHNDFARIEIGDYIRFAHELGDKGPQISSLTLLKKNIGYHVEERL